MNEVRLAEEKTVLKRYLRWYVERPVSIGDICALTELINQFLVRNEK